MLYGACVGGEVDDGPTEREFGAIASHMALHEVYGTIKEGKVVLLHGACVGDVDGPTKSVLSAVASHFAC